MKGTVIECSHCARRMEVVVSSERSPVMIAIVIGAIALAISAYFLYEPIRTRLFDGLKVAETDLPENPFRAAIEETANVAPGDSEPSPTLPQNELQVSSDGMSIVRVTEIPDDFVTSTTELVAHHECDEALILFFDRDLDFEFRHQNGQLLTDAEKEHLHCKVHVSKGKIVALSVIKEEQRIAAEKRIEESERQLVTVPLRQDDPVTEASDEFMQLVDGSGKYSTEARVTGLKVLEVLLETKAGRKVEVPFAWLSEESKSRISKAIRQREIADAPSLK